MWRVCQPPSPQLEEKLNALPPILPVDFLLHCHHGPDFRVKFTRSISLADCCKVVFHKPLLSPVTCGWRSLFSHRQCNKIPIMHFLSCSSGCPRWPPPCPSHPGPSCLCSFSVSRRTFTDRKCPGGWSWEDLSDYFGICYVLIAFRITHGLLFRSTF